MTSSTSHSAISTILFIVPYFGRLPHYTDLVLRTAAANPTICWKIVTDAPLAPETLPPNVGLRRMSLAEFRALAERKLQTTVALLRPYKVVDLKPTYGVVFDDEVAGYDFWGHCDLDQLFGDLRHFLTEPLLSRYPRLFLHGHLSIYRNTPEGNNYFRLTTPEIDYRTVLSDPRTKLFDEWYGMNVIMDRHGIPMHHDEKVIADISPFHYDLRVNDASANHRPQLFTWEQGHVYRYFTENGRVARDEFMYIHLQKRRMTLDAPGGVGGQDRWYVTPDRLTPMDDRPITAELMAEVNPPWWRYDLWMRWSGPYRRARRLWQERKLLNEHARGAARTR